MSQQIGCRISGDLENINVMMQCDKCTDRDTVIDVKLCNDCTVTELAVLFCGMTFGA
jgi:hypothetical protein